MLKNPGFEEDGEKPCPCVDVGELKVVMSGFIS